jgi:hypothetical protein
MEAEAAGAAGPAVTEAAASETVDQAPVDAREAVVDLLWRKVRHLSPKLNDKR